MFSTVLLGPVFLMVYWLFYSPHYRLGLAYLGWLLWDLRTCERSVTDMPSPCLTLLSSGGRRGWVTRWVRGWRLWKHFANFFPVRLVVTQTLDRNKNYLVCSSTLYLKGF